MPTPSIQTLRTDAQQVLNLDSISAVRSVVAATLANANAGTPLNPNLTTQQLWNEFYQIVTQPKSDIESIIANQLMKLMYAPPAPGGAGADKQVIFNDGGVLAGDPQFLWNKTTNLLTVTGSATITGDLTVDTSTLKVDSANNRVGIGTATPIAGSRLDVRSAIGTGTDIQSLAVIDTSPLAINNGGGISFGYVFEAPSTVIGRAGYIKTIKENATDSNYASAMVFGVAANGVATAERMRINSSGDVSLANGNLVMATSGKGIDFSATANGSGTMTSELLNDYEEGTFTPTVLGATTAGTATYASRAGYYTKIGRLVTVNIYMDWNSATGTGQMRFGGLPFTSSSSSLSFSSATFGLVNGIALTANHILTGYTETNNTVISANSYPAGGGTYTAVPIDAAGELVITCTYMAA